jgi:uncharacterized protein (DUF1015 family)
MPQLHPLRALRYAAAGGDVRRFIAPPYDVLDESSKQALLSVEKHNIVAIDLPVTPPKTLGPDEAYNRAGQTLRQWIEAGVLKRDAQPAVFAYEQAYRSGGQTIRRRGLFTGLKVEEFGRKGGGIHRHELTIRGGTDDRLKLMQATHAQLSPVFGVFPDPKNQLAEILADTYNRPADFHGITSNDRVEHRCWAVTNPAIINALQHLMKNTDVFIADGHHRYTTALNYAKENPSNPEAQFCLFVLIPSQDPGLVILPTHRVIKGMKDFSMLKLLDVLKSDGRFKLESTHHAADGLPHMVDDLKNKGHHAIGLYSPESGRTWAVSTVSDDPLADIMPDKAKVWRQLDVAVFHHFFIDKILKPNFGGDAITNTYPHELTELVRQSHEEKNRLGCVLQATPLQSVIDVSLAGEVMPPKSTFFFPKLATGLIINPLD